MTSSATCRVASAIFTGSVNPLYPVGDNVAPSGTNSQLYAETFLPNSSTVIKRVGVKRRIIHSITYLKVPVAAETVEIVKADGSSFSPVRRLGDGVTAPRQDHFDFGPEGIPFDGAVGIKLGNANAIVLVRWEDVQ